MPNQKTPASRRNGFGNDAPHSQMSWLGRINERAKVLNDVKVNVLTVVIFIACLAVITGVATGIAYVTHRGVNGVEHSRS